jgi:nucleotide-binding universal stress UspA family protein
MGTHGRRGVQRALLGSDAELVARYSAVPVLLVPARGRGGARKG